MYYFGYVIESGKGTAQEIELSKKMMRLLGNFGRTGVATTQELDGEWLNFNPGTAQNLLLFLTVTQYSSSTVLQLIFRRRRAYNRQGSKLFNARTLANGRHGLLENSPTANILLPKGLLKPTLSLQNNRSQKSFHNCFLII